MTVSAAFSSSSTYADDTTVTVAVAGGSATAGTDFAAVAGFALTIAAGAASGTADFVLTPHDDTEVEGNESIAVIGTATGLTVNGATLTLVDDDETPKVNDPVGVNLSVSPASVGEAAGATTVTVTATSAGGGTFVSDKALTISVGGGTALAGTDYAAVANFVLTIAAGAASGTANFILTPTDDTLVEGNDTTVTVAVGGGGTATAGTDFGTVQSFDVTIAAGATSGTANFTFTPTDDSVVEGNATIGVTGSASGLMVTGAELTLTDNDTLQLNVSSARADEGESLVFTVTLSPAAAQAVTVDYATADGTATAGADYTAASGQLQFAAGDTSRTVSVPATDDSNPEADETFTLAVTLADASASAAGTIVDNDMAVVTVSAPEVVESASAAVFTVMLAAPNPREVTVEFETTPGGTATAGVDYVDTSSVAVLAPGQTELEFSVPVLDDTELESIETMLVRLEATDQWNARVLTTEGAIHDDDAADVRSTGASRTLYLLARSMASEAVAAIGERFVGTDSTAPQEALGATPLAAGPGFGAAAGMGAAHPAAWSARRGGLARRRHGRHSLAAGRRLRRRRRGHGQCLRHGHGQRLRHGAAAE